MEKKQITQIRAKLRELSRYMPQKKECRDAAIHPTERGPKGGRKYICRKCRFLFSIEEINVDHIIPVIPVDRQIYDWNEHIGRLFCEVSNLQVLCKECHQIKTNEENDLRKSNGL